MVADEYYITSRHPTCDNFRTASKAIIASWLCAELQGCEICEVGAGKSVVAEQLLEIGQPLRHLLITDESRRMLAYSEQFEDLGATVRVADATQLPIASASIDLLISSLGDPYNLPAFWAEVARVLRAGGNAIFTTPAYAWAKHFRTKSTQTFAQAEFELLDGSKVLLPSFIYLDYEQRELIRKAGLEVIDTTNITIRDLQGERMSPKLGLDRGPDGEVVSGYLIEKPRSPIP